MTLPTPNPFNTKPPFSFPSQLTIIPSTTTSTPLPLSQGLLLSSSSDPLAPLELRLVSLLSYPCTAIVNSISQSPSAYPLMCTKGSMTGVADSGLVNSPSRMGMGMTIGTGTPQISLPGLIDETAGEDLAKWREQNWKEGLNAGACGVSGSCGLGDGSGAKIDEGKKIGKGRKRDEAYERPKYIIHTHAPNFADNAYSTPLVKQLLVNCYRGALVEAMGIAETEEEEEERQKKEDEQEEVEEEESAPNNEMKRMDENGIFPGSTKEDVIMTDTEPDTDENMLTEKESTPDMSRKRGLGSFGTVNMAGSMSGPASLASPRNISLDAFGVSPIPSPSILPSTSILSITSIPPILLSSSISSTSVPSLFHGPSKHHIPQSFPRPTGVVIAFPAISTGHKSFPHRLAARIAVGTVVFCVWPVDSPNRKALQVAFGLNFPPPLPQSAPLSPVSNQLSTPPFSPSVKGKRGFDFKLGLALRDFEGQESGVPKIVVTPPVTPMVGSGLSLSLGSGERDKYSSGLGYLEGKRLRRGDGSLGDKGSEVVEETGMDAEVENKKEKEKKKDLEVEIEAETEDDGDGIGVCGNLTAGVGQVCEEVREEEELKEELRLLKIEVEKMELKEQVRVLKAEIKRDCGRKDNRGRDKRGRKETYRQRKKQQGLRLAAAMRVRRDRDREREDRKGYLNLGERLRVGDRDTRTPERMPGINDGKMERSVDGRIGEKEVDPMKVADEGVLRTGVEDDTGSPESKLSIGEGRAERSQSQDKESQENKTVSGYVRRHGGSETRNKPERRYPEQVGIGDSKVGTKRERPSIVERGRPGGDNSGRGGRRLRKRRR